MPRRALVALIVVTSTVLSACTGGDPQPPADGEGGATSVTGPAVTGGGEPEHRTRLERTVEAIQRGKDAFVVVSQPRYLPMWDKLGRRDPDFVFDTRNPDGGHSPMLVADAAIDERGRAWFQIYLPIRPNGTTAWASQDDVRLQERHERLEVDLSARVLEHYRDDELVGRFEVGVGTPQYPTGTGTFYVWVRVPFANPNQPYGIFALGLSGFSPVLSDWPGEGRMAIHGTPYEANRGQAVSHGCVRVWNPDMESLVEVPLGTPVVISK